MAVTRVTQRMMSDSSLTSLQVGLGRLAKVQEQLTTGKILNRPSDSPTDSTAAMRMRSSIADQKQYARNGEDGLGWLGQIDTALVSGAAQVRRARELALQGANSGFGSQASREALAVEVEQIREGLIGVANTTYLGRPVFGGITAGEQAYDPATGAYVGAPGRVERRVADGVSVRVDVNGPEVFGPDGNNLFDQLDRLATALRAGDTAGVGAGLDDLAAGLDRLAEVLSDVGTRYGRIERAVQVAGDSELALNNSLAEVQYTDIPEATMELQLQEVAYQAALAASSRVLQPSLLEFLR